MSKLNLVLIIIIIIINIINTKCDLSIDVHIPLASDKKLIYSDCDRHDIFKNIPFHHVVPLVAKYINTHPKKRNIETIIKSPHFTSIVGGVVKSIQNQHLFGFLVGAGEHFADVVDHYVDVTKSVINPQDDENLWDQLNSKKINGKETKKSEVIVPLENIGGLIRSVVRYLPAEDSKHCYVKKLEPVAQKMKDQISSKEFKKLIGHVHKSSKKLTPTTPPPPTTKKVEESKFKKMEKEILAKNKNLLEKLKFSKQLDFWKNIKKE